MISNAGCLLGYTGDTQCQAGWFCTDVRGYNAGISVSEKAWLRALELMSKVQRKLGERWVDFSNPESSGNSSPIYSQNVPVSFFQDCSTPKGFSHLWFYPQLLGLHDTYIYIYIYCLINHRVSVIFCDLSMTLACRNSMTCRNSAVFPRSFRTSQDCNGAKHCPRGCKHLFLREGFRSWDKRVEVFNNMLHTYIHTIPYIHTYHTYIHTYIHACK